MSIPAPARCCSGRPHVDIAGAKHCYSPARGDQESGAELHGRDDTRHSNTEKVVFGFFIVLATTLNFGFFAGEIDNPSHHGAYELLAALVVSLIATVLKLSDRTQIGAVLLATSLVADLQLVAAAAVWGHAAYASGAVVDAETMATVVSLAGGALFANLVSAILLVVEIVIQRR